MIESASGESFRGHNLAATFQSRQKADQAADQLTKSLSGVRVELTSKREDRKVQQAEMRDELEGVVAAPALGSALTKSQTQGAVGGVVLVGGVGVLIGLIAGFLINGAPGSEISVVRWLLTWILTPAIAGGTLGMLAGGLLKQRHAPAPEDSAAPREASEDAGLARDEECVVEVSASTESELEKALDILQGLGPARLDQFDAEGKVVETQELGGRASN